MSYPSIKTIVEERGIAIASINKKEAEGLLWQAFLKDLPLGLNWLKALSSEVKATGARVLKTELPESALGKQIIRLLGTDVARAICEKNMGVAFGFYNCCSGVAAPTKSALMLDPREQIALQNGAKEYANC